MVGISHPLNLSKLKSTTSLSPPHPTFPPSQSDPRLGTEGTGLPSTTHGSGSGDNRSRGPCRALQFLQGCIPLPTHSPHSTLTSGGWGKHTVTPLREKWGDRDCDSSELHSPFSPPLLLLLPPAGYVLHMWYDRQSHAALPIHLSVHVCVA